MVLFFLKGAGSAGSRAAKGFIASRACSEVNEAVGICDCVQPLHVYIAMISSRVSN